MKATAQSKVLSALKKGMRVTRKTSIERGWSENITATISSLRKRGYTILSILVNLPDGSRFTRYKLVG